MSFKTTPTVSTNNTDSKKPKNQAMALFPRMVSIKRKVSMVTESTLTENIRNVVPMTGQVRKSVIINLFRSIYL